MSTMLRLASRIVVAKVSELESDELTMIMMVTLQVFGLAAVTTAVRGRRDRRQDQASE